MAKAAYEQGVVDALVRAGLLADPSMVKSITITVGPELATTVVVERFVLVGQVPGMVQELVREGYRLVKE